MPDATAPDFTPLASAPNGAAPDDHLIGPARPARGVSRRGFIAVVAGALPALALPRTLFADASASRALNFVHTHTSERLEVAYFSGGQYLRDALDEVNSFLRDFRTGDVHPIDPDLLDLLHDLAQATGSSRPFQVISGYRSPATNAALRQRSGGVAAGSLHMTGQAIDIRLADVPLARLRDAALDLGRGGVGYYPASNFLHVDTGRVRTW
jgi:uncharacterized protein YcbK (DUF882 family)